MKTDYQKIRSAIEQAIKLNKHNFIVYPYGEYGVIAKQILNDSFGIREAYVIDNKLSAFNSSIKNLEFCEELDRNEYTVLFTCANPDVYDEVLHNLLKYFSKDNIVEIFKKIDNKLEKGTEDNPYELIVAFATYAPWRKEKKFKGMYEIIKNRTLVDVYRCYELWQLLIQSKKCKSGDILEVGVYKGGTGALLAAAARYAQIDAQVFLCDTFEGVVKTGAKDNLYKGGEHSDTSFEYVKDLIDNLSLENVHIFKGIFPDDVSEIFDTKTYRFVHIDVDAYQSAKDVFNYVWKMMEIGGIVVFDDYGFECTQGVTVMIEEIWNSIQDGIFVGNINGHGMFIKTSDSKYI
ncbi:MAG: class I SAM-dependent methyltransferase [Clostridiales bacterium]|nr:class I SAM-dependent methyltransferase [Clostridiales bacterium]